MAWIAQPFAAIVDPWIQLDGRLNAPAGAAQRPTILNGYPSASPPGKRIRWSASTPNGNGCQPPWMVAGVDYAVGPNFTPTGDPTTIPGTGPITRSGTVITVSGTDAVLDGYDLTSGWQVVLTGTRAKMTNCYIKAIDPDRAVFIHGTDCQVNYNIIDGNSTSSFNIRFNNSSGTGVFMYNYILGSQSDMIYVDQTTNSQHVNITAKYNLVDGGGSSAGAHADLWQMGSGTFDDMEILFNTWYVNNPVQGTQGINMCDGTSGSINNTVNVKNNTGFSIGSVGAMDFFIGSAGGGVILNGPFLSNQNYFDPTAATGGQLYPTGSTIPPGISSKNNINMLTGSSTNAGWNN